MLFGWQCIPPLAATRADGCSRLFACTSNFPCKGYASDVGTISQAVDTLTAGQQYTVKLAGTATHRGGSCQISLS